MLTHNDSASLASCLALVRILWELLKVNTVPPPELWLETFVATARDLEVDESYTSRSPNSMVVDACNRWYSEAYLRTNSFAPHRPERVLGGTAPDPGCRELRIKDAAESAVSDCL
jgi:hypothetical protein